MTKSDSTPLKSAVVVIGALAFAWAAIELAFKPLLDKARGSINKSDPKADADDVTVAEKSVEEPPAADAAADDAAAAAPAADEAAEAAAS